jgi:hypothetical protein
MDGSISDCIYLFQFKFGNFCRNSAKEVLYDHWEIKNILCSELKTIFGLKFDS